MNREFLDASIDAKTKSSQSLRNRQDIAKYLKNLNEDAPNYDGKSRAMNENPNPDLPADE